ncbi:MAG TPA: hypothetical protein VLV56_16300 [Burkholderiales bacterium]|nr:hypothetical protein [Burkholderiales bacterium]
MIYSYTYLFSGCDHGGIAMAEMKVRVNLNPATNKGDVEVKTYNMSPITLLNASGHNLPAISAFGFEIKYSHISWELRANKYTGGSASGSAIIGEDGGAPIPLWQLGPASPAVLKTSYAFGTVYPSTLPGYPDGRLYNPDAIPVLPHGPANNFFATEARLLFDVNGGECPLCEFSNPWILMTNVGHGNGRVGMRGIGFRIT